MRRVRRGVDPPGSHDPLWLLLGLPAPTGAERGRYRAARWRPTAWECLECARPVLGRATHDRWHRTGPLARLARLHETVVALFGDGDRGSRLP